MDDVLLLARRNEDLLQKLSERADALKSSKGKKGTARR
jgi:hypothetical protein